MPSTALGGEGVELARANAGKVGDFPGDQGEVMDQRRCSKLLVNCMLVMGYAQPAPDLCHVNIERQDLVSIALKHGCQPSL
jgi:hypothetical protein